MSALPTRKDARSVPRESGEKGIICMLEFNSRATFSEQLPPAVRSMVIVLLPGLCPVHTKLSTSEVPLVVCYMTKFFLYGQSFNPSQSLHCSLRCDCNECRHIYAHFFLSNLGANRREGAESQTSALAALVYLGSWLLSLWLNHAGVLAWLHHQ